MNLLFDLPKGYHWQKGFVKDKTLLVKYLQLTYQELFPTRQDFSYLINTVEQYFSAQTPLWWVVWQPNQEIKTPIACLWMGSAIAQVSGDHYGYIFLLYVTPQHRHQGIATQLIQQAENWAKTKNFSQIGLHVFNDNLPAINLYERLGFQTQSYLMFKSL